MNATEISTLARYLNNVSLKEFARFIYTSEVDYYTTDKYSRMQHNTLSWIGELDGIRLTYLADAVKEYKIKEIG